MSGRAPSDEPDGHLMRVVREVIAQHEWRYIDLGGGRVTLSLSGARAVYTLLLAVDERTGLVQCGLALPARVTEERRTAVAEALTRANWMIGLGNFELDFSDGELRFRVSIDAEGGEFTPVMLNNMISCAWGMAERYHDAIMTVAFGGADPAAAIAAAEAQA